MYKDIEVRWSGDLPGTPEQIWDGFTRHAAAYLWPIEYEPRAGGAERGLTPGGGTVTVWEPLRRLRTEARSPEGWHNELDYTLDGAHLTYVHTSVMQDSELEVQYDSCVQHTRFYLHSLGEYLGHFAGRDPHYLGLDEVPGTTADVLARLGIDAQVGERTALGVVDCRDGTMVGVRSDDALVRVYGRDVWGWPVGVGVHSFAGPVDEAAWREKAAA